MPPPTRVLDGGHPWIVGGRSEIRYGWHYCLVVLLQDNDREPDPATFGRDILPKKTLLAVPVLRYKLSSRSSQDLAGVVETRLDTGARRHGTATRRPCPPPRTTSRSQGHGLGATTAAEEAALAPGTDVMVLGRRRAARAGLHRVNQVRCRPGWWRYFLGCKDTNSVFQSGRNIELAFYPSPTASSITLLDPRLWPGSPYSRRFPAANPATRRLYLSTVLCSWPPTFLP